MEQKLNKQEMIEEVMVNKKIHGNKGKKHSEETKAKRSLSMKEAHKRGNFLHLKGKPSWNKGFKQWANGNHPRGMLGKKGHGKFSEDTKNKMRETHKINKKSKGKHYSPNTEFKKGLTPWNKDSIGLYTASEETRKKLSDLHKGHKVSKETRKKIGDANRGSKGFKHSEKSKKNMCGRTPWNKGLKGYHIHSEEFKEKLRERMKTFVLPVKDSSIEVKIQNFLKELGIEFFTHQYMKEIEHGYQCDILIPSMNLVIECDGNYWHKYPIGLDRDHIRTKELIEKGFKVLRLWECEIRPMNIIDFKNKLEEVNKNSI